MVLLPKLSFRDSFFGCCLQLRTQEFPSLFSVSFVDRKKLTMALELVGGAFLSASFQVVIEKMASLKIVDSIWGKKLNEGLFRELKIMLLSANAVVKDAEDKQVWNTNVREWLHELQAAVYDAEDLVQAIDAEALRCKIEAEYGSSSSSHCQVLNLLPMPATSFKQQVESKMRVVIDTLKFILDQKVHLGLKEGSVQTISSKRIPATSTVEESGVYGTDDDKEAIIKLLLATDESSGEKFSVIPIVGMGGIGKTTLAQLVYNDERVKNCFGFKAWVSVSYEFDIFKITKLITERVANSPSFNNSDDLDLLQVKLQEALEGKKFLLVLDDVWNEDYFQWEELKKPFESGACGSKIIVTTRNESVSSVMRNNNIPSFQIQTMSDENCWKLFVKHAFVNVDPCCHPKLEEIGRKIVQKCKGLPLAVKSLGSILRHQLHLEEWETILKSDIWDLPKQKNSILPALWLSYQYLPSNLKRCFAYCSVFPKNYEIDKDELIKLWMAEDLLEPQNNKRIEKVGEDYFDDLSSRSLFQKSRWFRATMHDLVHDLATFVAGDFCLSLNGNNSDKLLSKVRHLSCLKEQSLEHNYEDLFKVKCLRTLSFPSNCYRQLQLDLDFLDRMNLWATLACLRSLSFHGCSIAKLSDSIGNLKLLRYLNLSKTMISEVPNTVCRLYNLQTLILSACFELKLLPTEMGRLINLRHLNIASTNLEKMPLQMCNLKNLQMLTDFVAGKYSGYTIRLLKDSLFAWKT
ncbi:putative disease resistance RPP13-like protein 1 [Ziziphus jujuba]|uniref:Disease resistance RPP13-like protein 1 n=1 Tax=Ziziphus jujuba TaxID=326968 RepID=A0A6P6G6D2_ZIZJJ|nr:putative disease resistance RPP13-like protein 1 [Ziziphus jujuba]XP_024929658.1 putative disease resistance RPP13-like protein 1 [Ziziphus jujuba]XP_024929660.1 putative disease resistance RPP13-like protein 1 [Ziziphus jujuba]XP_024929661.1 putative disease resistance RPP13-like protein 1 [Ziziphus jujuba]XP_048330492.1 putative disease resistance RPP13-like protein 1 [Ziziphus jujuba]XP_060670788.1 putative disease resistance RPP13-like protein 1 [Ziziphus jujuba]XP_060670789.1 putative